MFKIATIFSCAICAMILSACGGGGGSTAQPQAASVQPASTVPATPNVVTISAQGDSTMAGYETVNGVGTVTANSAPAMLQAQLRATLGNDSITVQNNALSGTNTYQLLNGLSPYIRTLAAFLPIDSQAQIWICNFAINDARSYTTDQYGQYLTQWVATVRAAGRIAILEEPNPTTDSSVPDLRPYVAMMDYVATQMNVPIVQQYSYIQSLPLWQTMLTDGIHPNDALYAIKAQREAEVLTPIVRSLQ